MQRRIAWILVALVFSAQVAAQNANIESLMTADELRATGVADLSPEQKAALNDWLQRYLAAETSLEGSSPGRAEESSASLESVAPAAPTGHQTSTAVASTVQAQSSAPADDFGRPAERVEIQSRIAGEFNGWTGRTRFALENGQVWEQRRGRRWKINLDSPEVRIYQNFMGAYEMEVVSEDRSIGVRRIR